VTDSLDDLLDGPDEHDLVERPGATGIARVDAVIDAVAGAADQPPVEQVAVFEQVHAELRRTLDEPGTA
jgi:hypothetical protein